MLDIEKRPCISWPMTEDSFPKLAELPQDGNPWIARYEHIVDGWLTGLLDHDDAYHQSRFLWQEIVEESRLVERERALPDYSIRLRAVEDADPYFAKLVPLQRVLWKFMDDSQLADTLEERGRLFQLIVENPSRGTHNPHSR